jgi:hypothetical protein
VHPFREKHPAMASSCLCTDDRSWQQRTALACIDLVRPKCTALVLTDSSHQFGAQLSAVGRESGHQFTKRRRHGGRGAP